MAPETIFLGLQIVFRARVKGVGETGNTGNTGKKLPPIPCGRQESPA